MAEEAGAARSPSQRSAARAAAPEGALGRRGDGAQRQELKAGICFPVFLSPVSCTGCAVGNLGAASQ